MDTLSLNVKAPQSFPLNQAYTENTFPSSPNHLQHICKPITFTPSGTKTFFQQIYFQCYNSLLEIVMGLLKSIRTIQISNAITGPLTLKQSLGKHIFDSVYDLTLDCNPNPKHVTHNRKIHKLKSVAISYRNLSKVFSDSLNSVTFLIRFSNIIALIRHS